jgi:hypothetical protein
MGKTNRYLEAFKESYNTIGLAGVVALSAATLNPLPLLGALVIEAAYLMFVPDSKWYDARLSARYDNEVLQRRQKLKEQVFPVLGPATQARFTKLEMLREQINAQTLDGKKFFREVLRKLDYLLEKFLLFAQKEVQFNTYLQSVLDDVNGVGPTPPIQLDRPPQRVKKRSEDEDDGRSPESRDHRIRAMVANIQGQYDSELKEIEDMLGNSENLHNQAILEKRQEVLTRRKEYIAKIGETLENLSHQLNLIQDTFGLINDEIRARSPEQVLADIDDVVYQTDNLTEVLEDVAPFDTMPVAPGAAKLYDVPEGS